MRSHRPSQTAILIARSTWLLSRDPQLSRLVPPGAGEACRRFLEAAGIPDRQLGLADRAWFRSFALSSERFSIPGVSLHYAVRKRWLEDITRRVLADGIAQVVVMGAGLDTLALRLHWEFPGVMFVGVRGAGAAGLTSQNRKTAPTEKPSISPVLRPSRVVKYPAEKPTRSVTRA